MAKKRNKAAAKKKDNNKVVLYAVGLPPKAFDPVHAERLLNRLNTKWSKEPFDTIESEDTTAATVENGTSDNPAT